jgi:predicted alpha/beta-fold hydrolase
MDGFMPRPSLQSGHKMTLFSWGNPRYFPQLGVPTRRYFDVDHDARVVADCHWQPRPWTRPTLVALHGLNGSSEAHYMRGLAAKAFARGMNIVRLNQRNCGDTEHLSAGLFHSGLTVDAAHVIDELITVDGLRAIARRERYGLSRPSHPSSRSASASPRSSDPQTCFINGILSGTSSGACAGRNASGRGCSI